VNGSHDRKAASSPSSSPPAFLKNYDRLGQASKTVQVNSGTGRLARDQVLRPPTHRRHACLVGRRSSESRFRTAGACQCGIHTRHLFARAAAHAGRGSPEGRSGTDGTLAHAARSPNRHSEVVMQRGLRGSFRIAGSRTGQTIGLRVVLSPNMGDREIERPSQLAADPIQRIKPRAPAAILTTHLLDHYFGI
jgi:hypothetical protein